MGDVSAVDSVSDMSIEFGVECIGEGCLLCIHFVFILYYIGWDRILYYFSSMAESERKFQQS